MAAAGKDEQTRRGCEGSIPADGEYKKGQGGKEGEGETRGPEAGINDGRFTALVRLVTVALGQPWLCLPRPLPSASRPSGSLHRLVRVMRPGYYLFPLVCARTRSSRQTICLSSAEHRPPSTDWLALPFSFLSLSLSPFPSLSFSQCFCI